MITTIAAVFAANVEDRPIDATTERAFAANVPVLGICQGEQTMAQPLGGQVEAGHHRERFVSC